MPEFNIVNWFINESKKIENYNIDQPNHHTDEELEEDEIFKNLASHDSITRSEESIKMESVLLTNELFKLCSNHNKTKSIAPDDIQKQIIDMLKGGKKIECTLCKKAHLVIRMNKKLNKEFVGCSNFPECKFNY